MDRQTLLQVLYDSITAKSKIHTSQRVVSVSLIHNGVKILTKDGSTFTGDILVGADGVHSTVRREMWRIAEMIQPGYVPTSEWKSKSSLLEPFQTRWHEVEFF
jgi:2-polyprenyl-6-methoxyphenol hydroxylase-like FAD-dependent oxidoreductase